MNIEKLKPVENFRPELSVIQNSEDLQDILTISAEFNKNTFKYSSEDLEVYAQKLQEPHALQIIAKNEPGEVVAFMAASESIFPNNLFISELLVDTEVQGKGVGKTLVEYAINFAQNEGLEGVYTETETWNFPAQSLYERCGFTEVENPGWHGLTYKIIFNEPKAMEVKEKLGIPKI